MASKVEGLAEVLKNFDNKQKAVGNATASGMRYALRHTTNYIKQEFVYKKTGRGFDDITGNLRNSINWEVDRLNADKIIGIEYVGMEYAPYVEFRWEGRHAFLYPGVLDEMPFIQNTIKEAIEAAVKGLQTGLLGGTPGDMGSDAGSLGEAIDRGSYEF